MFILEDGRIIPTGSRTCRSIPQRDNSRLCASLPDNEKEIPTRINKEYLNIQNVYVSYEHTQSDWDFLCVL